MERIIGGQKDQILVSMSLLYFNALNYSFLEEETERFVNATLLSDTAKINNLNTLVKSLKAYGLWNKIYVLYPFCSDGINATREFQHSFNLKDPRDLDAAHRITWNGTRTHTNSGSFTDAYADTHFNPYLKGVVATDCAVMFATTSGTDAGEKLSWGAYTTGGVGIAGYTSLNCGPATNANTYTQIGGNWDFHSGPQYCQTLIASRNNSSSYDQRMYGTIQNDKNITTASAGVPNLNLYLWACNVNGSVTGGGSTCNRSFFVILKAITSTEMTNLYYTYNAFQNGK